MMKKFFSIILCFLTVFFCAGCGEKKGYIRLEEYNCHAESAVAEDHWNTQKEGLAFYELAMADFKTADGRYTEDFGGKYIDENGFYNICVVGRQPSDSEYVKYKKVDFSLNFLTEIYNEASALMQEYGVWQVDICARCNAVKICIEAENKIQTLIQRLKENGLFKKDALMFYVRENSIKPSEEKVYSQATMEDDFTQDRVIITLTKQETRKFKTYTPEDFPEIDCETIEELTEGLTETVEQYFKTGELQEGVSVEPEAFRRIFRLILREKTKENVLSAIRKLERRKDIWAAEPNYISYIEDFN